MSGLKGAPRASWLLCVLFAAVAALVAPGLALADATPVQLVLLYMANVSNSGTTSASGIGELVMLEGEVRITAADLPRLDGNKRYVAWVINTETHQFHRLGSFNSAQATGAVRFENVLPDPIPDKHWNLLLVTVEDSATPERPSDTHSIAGVFPNAEGQILPGVLPNTGGGLDASYPAAVSRPEWLLSAGLAALAAALGLAAGYAVGMKKR
jgi:hypothetical protein